MSQSSDLIRLQRIDTRRDQATNRVRDIDQILQADATMRLAQDLLDSTEKQLNSAKKSLHTAEETVQFQRIKIEQTEASLYGGSVRNPKELQDLQNEAASLKKYLATLEDNQLEAMIALEQIEHDHASAKTDLETARQAFLQKQSGFLQEKDALQKEIAKLDSERFAAVNQVPETNLNDYEKLRRLKRGLAVSAVSDQCCEACGATLAPAEWQIARSPLQLFHCPNCGRILYAG
jgi:predicted  nucleic acid-binding Zn-ribbon protein